MQPVCNYNQSHQQYCYPIQQSIQQSCQNYQQNSPSAPYGQCSSSRAIQPPSQYCSPPNYGSQVNGEVASPATGQVMSPNSHYAPTHLSDQPLTSPAAGALAPQYALQNLPQNSAQLTRNCQQNHVHQTYYPGYNCAGQINTNCTTNTANQRNHHSNQNCALSSNHVIQMRLTSNCQQLSPNCAQSIANPPAIAPSNLQCNQSSNQCTRPMTSNSHIPIVHSAQQPSMTTQCSSMSPHCPQLNLTSQNKITNTVTNHLSSYQQQTQQSTALCLQINNCIHPNDAHRQINDSGASKRTSPQLCNAQQTNNCRMQQQQQQQICTHNCQARTNPHQQYDCNCSWTYGNQCYQNDQQHSGPLPEIQCKDISQSQGSSVKPPQGMRQDSYRRTLEYVQQCRNWSDNAQNTNETNVSSSTHPIILPQPLPASVNMIINDMTSSLSSLMEENRYLQMIQ